MKNNKRYIDYIDNDRLKISFSCLLMRVDSINRNFGLLKDFAIEYDLNGFTNGRLYGLTEMKEPIDTLYEIINNVLIPCGLQEKRDYVVVFEVLTKDVNNQISPLINCQIPELKEIDWISRRPTRLHCR